MAAPTTDHLMKRVDALTKSLKTSPSAAVGKLVTELEGTITQIEQVLHTAWDYCGKHPQNGPAFTRYSEILECYVKGSDAINAYRSGRRT